MIFQYGYLRQNPLINNFCKLGPYSLTGRHEPKNSTVSLLHGVKVIKKEKLSVSIHGYAECVKQKKTTGIRTSMFKLLDIIILWFNQNNNVSEVKFQLDEYMRLCVLVDPKETRRQINSDLEILSAISLGYKSKSVTCSDMRLIENGAIKNGLITVRLAYDFANMLSKCPVMPYPLALLSIRGDKFPNAPYILRKMAEQKNLNYKKPNENVISVRTLLESSPLIPAIEAVRGSSNRSQKERIITPLIRDLNEACSKVGISKYSFVLKDFSERREISGEEFFNLPYEVIVGNVSVHFSDEWLEYPVRTFKEKEAEISTGRKHRSSGNKGDGDTPKGGKLIHQEGGK